MANIGYSTLSVIPSAKGFGASLAGQTTPQMAAAGAAGGAAFATAAVAGIAIIAAASAVVITTAFKIGESFDSAADTIRIGTGATGAALEALQDDFRAVVADVPTDFGKASTAIADLNTRTGQTGVGLQDLAKQVLEMTRITGGDLSANIASVTRLFGDWSIVTGDQSATMDYLFKVSQSTGIGIDSLSDKVTQFGAPLRQLGFTFEESAALLGKWEKEGVNAEAVLAGMKIGLANLSNAGVEPVQALKDVQQAIKDAGSAGEANQIAIETFGQRAGPDMAAAIREGRFEVDELMASLDASGETILGAAADTNDFAESWTLFKNNVLLVIEPIATRVFDAFGTGMDWLRTNAAPALDAFGGAMSTTLMPALETVGSFFTDTVIPAVQTFFAALGGNSELGEFDGALGLANDAGVLLGDTLEALSPVVQAARDTWDALVAIWQEKIQPAFSELATLFRENVTPELDDFNRTLTEELKPAMEDLWAYLEVYVLPGVVKLAQVWAESARVMVVYVLPALVNFGSWMATYVIRAISDATIIMGFLIESFQSLGRAATVAGSYISASFKSTFNGIAGMWNSTVGKLSFSIPDRPGVPNRGQSFTMPRIPLLADGGIVSRATLAMVGEGPEPEAVIPLSKLDAMLSNGGGSSNQDIASFAREVAAEIQALTRAESGNAINGRINDAYLAGLAGKGTVLA